MEEQREGRGGKNWVSSSLINPQHLGNTRDESYDIQNI
jgi:hypothetical protein